MKKESITIQMDGEKLRAVKRYMEKKDADLTKELCDSLQKLYEKYVPSSVREYIDEGIEGEAPAEASPKKQKEKISPIKRKRFNHVLRLKLIIKQGLLLQNLPLSSHRLPILRNQQPTFHHP